MHANALTVCRIRERGAGEGAAELAHDFRPSSSLVYYKSKSEAFENAFSSPSQHLSSYRTLEPQPHMQPISCTRESVLGQHSKKWPSSGPCAVPTKPVLQPPPTCPVAARIWLLGCKSPSPVTGRFLVTFLSSRQRTQKCESNCNRYLICFGRPPSQTKMPVLRRRCDMFLHHALHLLHTVLELLELAPAHTPNNTHKLTHTHKHALQWRERAKTGRVLLV